MPNTVPAAATDLPNLNRRSALARLRLGIAASAAMGTAAVIFSEGKSLTIMVGDLSAASLAGKYMSAVGRFLETNDLSALAPFVGRSVVDLSGKEHPLETRPNVLYRLAAAGEHTFEQVYKIVI